LVLSDTYGPGDHRPKILNLIKSAVESGEELALSDGTQDFDLTYIDDVVRAFRQAGKQLLSENWTNETFQVAPENPLSLRQTVDLMIEVNGLDANLKWGARPTTDREMRKAVRVCPILPGWKVETPLPEGLKKIIQTDINQNALWR